MILFVRHTMENHVAVSIMATMVIGVPILGIWAIHKFKWQHWEPFKK